MKGPGPIAETWFLTSELPLSQTSQATFKKFDVDSGVLRTCFMYLYAIQFDAIMEVHLSNAEALATSPPQTSETCGNHSLLPDRLKTKSRRTHYDINRHK
jgi:hypothetical protein